MADKITKLTPEQSARFAEWSEKWIKIGLSTEPADFDLATSAALQAYELAGLKKPKIVLRMGSPLAACLGGVTAWSMLREMSGLKSQVRSQVGSQVESQVWSQVGSQVWSQVGSQVESHVESQVWSQVRSQVGSQVESQVWSQVRSQVGSQIESQVWSQVGSQVESQVRSQVGSQVEGQVESQVESQVRSQVESQVESQVGSILNNSYTSALYASWGAYISFFRDVCDWDNPVLERFKIDEDLIQSCGWTWWHEDVLAISDRPKSILRDDQGRLHNETGPSMLYQDGWSLWHWHGVAVPSEWIMNKTGLTAQIALGQTNVEQRRAACELVGWTRILDDLKGTTIDRDDDPQIGELIEVSLPDAPKERFLRVQCGTGRSFAIPVPPTVKTALEGNCWTYDIPPDLLKLKEHRT